MLEMLEITTPNSGTFLSASKENKELQVDSDSSEPDCAGFDRTNAKQLLDKPILLAFARPDCHITVRFVSPSHCAEPIAGAERLFEPNPSRDAQWP